MKLFVSSKISVLLIGFCAVLLVGAGSAEADFIFGTPTNLGSVVNSSAWEHPGGMTADGLTLYFASLRPGGYSEWVDIWTTTRPTKDDPWEEPVNLGLTVNTSMSEWEPDISTDGLTMVFNCRWAGTVGTWDVWITTRQTTDDPWPKAVNLGTAANSSTSDGAPSISADGLTIFFESTRSGGQGDYDVWMTTRQTIDDSWSESVNLGPPVNSSSTDGEPDISDDGRTLFFSSRRSGGLGGKDLWVTRRLTTNDPWGPPLNLGTVVNSSGDDGHPRISADGRLLLFDSSRPGGRGDADIWQVPIIPVVDFNGDGFVDSADMCIMVDHWGTDEQLCDIGPSPLGDGIVDIQDMVIFAEYLFDEALPLDLVAHWKLDETEGDTALDSAGNNDTFILGGPLWQPNGGMVDGALELDGVDDCVITSPIPNIANGSFRVFAWVKSDYRQAVPGQAVLSQMGGANWLCTDPLEGNLMTELRSAGQDGCSLISETVIIDGDWHRIGLVWDGSHRTLYVDDIVVAEDTQTNLEASENGLYIGAGTAMQPGTYWSGLIDDVRIYNRVVRP